MKLTTITAAALASAVLVLPGCRREPAPAETSSAANAAQAVDDAWITTKVESQYFVNPEVKGRQIDVSTKDGVVTLTGVVDSELARQRAVTIARGTEGVTNVQDRMAVKLPDQVATTGTTAPATGDRGPAAAAENTGEDLGDTIGSAWTTTKIQAQYFADPDVKGHNIDVTTHDHVVTLAGRVENDAQRAKAVRIARETEGVTDVRDRLRIGAETAAAPAAETAPAPAPAATSAEPSAGDSGLVARVQAKFYQNADLRPSQIDVAAENGVVTLSGTVSSEARKRDAVAVARNTDGVADVHDNLVVDRTVPPLPGQPAAAADKDSVDLSTQAADAWVTTKIQSRFYLDPDVKGRNIDVSTEQGVVTLSGEVTTAAIRDQAMTIARETEGVTRVVDRLTVAGGGR